MEHVCKENTYTFSMIVTIKRVTGGEWEMDVIYRGDDTSTVINYCPFCGEKLE